MDEKSKVLTNDFNANVLPDFFLPNKCNNVRKGKLFSENGKLEKKFSLFGEFHFIDGLLNTSY